MNNLPTNLPFELNLDPYPFYASEIFPYNMYRRHQPRQHSNPINMHTLGMISALAPHIRQLENNGIAKDSLDQHSSKKVSADEDHDFHILIDVGFFAPEELTVKIINDHVVVEGTHEERQADDVGFVARHFIRRYTLPQNYNPDAIVSKLSPDGMLSVTLPKPNVISKERIITIEHVGPNKCLKEDKDETKIAIEQEKNKQ